MICGPLNLRMLSLLTLFSYLAFGVGKQEDVYFDLLYDNQSASHFVLSNMETTAAAAAPPPPPTTTTSSADSDGATVSFTEKYEVRVPTENRNLEPQITTLSSAASKRAMVISVTENELNEFNQPDHVLTDNEYRTSQSTVGHSTATASTTFPNAITTEALEPVAPAISYGIFANDAETIQSSIVKESPKIDHILLNRSDVADQNIIPPIITSTIGGGNPESVDNLTVYSHLSVEIIKAEKISDSAHPTPKMLHGKQSTGVCYQRPIIRSCHFEDDRMPLGSSIWKRTTTWYYDPIEMVCQYTSDCILNDNAFNSLKECESRCIPLSGIRRCLAPPKAGYVQCSDQSPSQEPVPILRTFFDKTSGKCRWFTYYGCGGTPNRFRSMKECEDTCTDLVASRIFMVAAELCQIAPSVDHLDNWATSTSEDLQEDSNSTVIEYVDSDGFALVEPGCSNAIQMESRWYFDIRTRTCKEFAFDHCGGSANNFLTRTDCEQFCEANKEDTKNLCRQPPDVGQCNQRKQMWYFDPSYRDKHTEKGACRPFTYSGCGGNSNRFADRLTCEQTCSDLKMADDVSWGRVESLTETITPAATPLDIKINKFNHSGSKASDGTESEKLSTSQKSGGKVDQVQAGRGSLELLNIDIEPCRRPAVTGSCRPLNCSQSQRDATSCEPIRIQRWFFNAHTSNCEPFYYSGCGGTENTFDDAQSCQVSCKARIVRSDRDRRCDSLPHQTKCYALSLIGSSGVEKNGTRVAFHFIVGSSTCRAFHLDTSRPGCSSEPYFENGHECLKACVKSTPTERHLQNRCFARKTHPTRNCSTHSEKSLRWSYLPELNQCVQFSQCGPPGDDPLQPGNNFASRGACETTCMATSLEEVCQLPMDPGPCAENQPRYYYDAKALKCRMFLYGGCLGNANRFVSKQECVLACADFPALMIKPNMSNALLHPNDTIIGEQEAPALSAELFDQMRRITQHHTDHFPWDLCLESHSYGTCSVPTKFHQGSSEYAITHLTRYFYDRRQGTCEPFSYTGCGAHGNHFDTITDCQRVCEQRLRNSNESRCQELTGITQCPGSGLHGWRFNHSVGDCHLIELCPTNTSEAGSNRSKSDRLRFRRASQLLGSRITQLPSGVYATRSACQYHCLPKPPRGTDAQNMCHMNPIVTVPFGCNAMVTRWYFEPREGTCRSYISCPQYGNDFSSEKTCMSVCSPSNPMEVCRLPRDHGGCSNLVTRWYYDVKKRECLPFLYGGCFGNSNRFLTKAECDSFCYAQDVCRLPLQKNSTDTTYPTRFYYNQESGQCEMFHFTGLLAHGNHFLTAESCKSTCVDIPDLEAISGPLYDRAEQIHSNTMKAEDKPSVSSQYETITVMGNLERRSPCVSSLSEHGPMDLVKQSICDATDIVHELGYTFRAVRTRNDRDEEVEGFCELTLVPICLNENHKRIIGTVVNPTVKSIGRVFQTQSECEMTCLQNRRIRRSIQTPEFLDSRSLEKALDKLLRGREENTDANSNTVPPRNGCTPEKPTAEQADHFKHSLQAFTRWPCRFDTKLDRSQIPLIERLEGGDAWLRCWVLSSEVPVVKWTRLKDRKSYSITPIKMPAMNDIWMAHLHLHRLDPFRHNGAWLCQVRSPDGPQTLEAFTLLHVAPKQLLTMALAIGTQTYALALTEHVITVPEGGTLLLACRLTDSLQGYFSSNHITWRHSGSPLSNYSIAQLPQLNGVQFLHIHPVDSARHAGLWTCAVEPPLENQANSNQLNYFVQVGTAPGFTQPASFQTFSVSKHQRSRPLRCAEADRGSPTGQLTWYQCTRPNECWPIRDRSLYSSGQTLRVSPIPGGSYICRIENMWGRVEQRFEFIAR